MVGGQTRSAADGTGEDRRRVRLGSDGSAMDIALRFWMERILVLVINRGGDAGNDDGNEVTAITTTRM